MSDEATMGEVFYSKHLESGTVETIGPKRADELADNAEYEVFTSRHEALGEDVTTVAVFEGSDGRWRFAVPGEGPSENDYASKANAEKAARNAYGEDVTISEHAGIDAVPAEQLNEAQEAHEADRQAADGDQ